LARKLDSHDHGPSTIRKGLPTLSDRSSMKAGQARDRRLAKEVAGPSDDEVFTPADQQPAGEQSRSRPRGKALAGERTLPPYDGEHDSSEDAMAETVASTPEAERFDDSADDSDEHDLIERELDPQTIEHMSLSPLTEAPGGGGIQGTPA
jgi:hypothetical protein